MASRTLFFALSAAALMMPAAQAAQAAELDVMLDGQTALSYDQLAGMRGGFFTANGAQFDFGASIKTMVNGELALQTSLQWTPAGAVTQQLAGLGPTIQSPLPLPIPRPQPPAHQRSSPAFRCPVLAARRKSSPISVPIRFKTSS
jgi:hypothetical protein